MQLLQERRPLLIGHRGCSALAPENTIPSFEHALQAGVDLVEFDYRHSADGVPIVFHDDTLERTTDAIARWGGRRTRVSDHTAAEIQELDAGAWFAPRFAGTRVPTLLDALEFICGRGGTALIEHKSGEAQTLVELLRSTGFLNRVVVISFDWQFLRGVHALEPAIVIGALGDPLRLADGRTPQGLAVPLLQKLSPEWLDLMNDTGARVAVWHREITPEAVRLAHKRGLKVWIYTVDDATTATELIAMGVNGIITNDPSDLRLTIDAGVVRTHRLPRS
ncbi:MAG TPA: glycerophosphodiester phosphodiesterase [Verrucomicrobia bacterium]|nr:glycerophosphodiester phosphodiesterase [Verrucomicrobiota bacterium]HOP97185.1 glycerophosphodiester phosphodiesterase family protein [Verrucomicrobiota bacterium]HPU55699.1 glycerophosphodiester phosphodiesterase family protein [Verrucomicrobiota bacterium]